MWRTAARSTWWIGPVGSSTRWRPHLVACRSSRSPSGPRAQASAAAAATAASALPASVLALLATIQADDPAGISLCSVTIGSCGGAARTAVPTRPASLSALLARPGTVFDVSDPDLVYAR